MLFSKMVLIVLNKLSIQGDKYGHGKSFVYIKVVTSLLINWSAGQLQKGQKPVQWNISVSQTICITL